MPNSGRENNGGDDTGATRHGEALPSEYKLLAAGLATAPVPEKGVLTLSHFPVPDGTHDDRRLYRIAAERDHSSLVPKLVATLGDLEETVVECTPFEPGMGQEPANGHFRVVAVYVKGGARHRLIVVLRRNEEEDREAEVEEERSDRDLTLGALALREFLELAKAHSLKVGDAPLIGLDYQLADPKDRLLLNKEGIPYALLVESSLPFTHVRWRMHDAPDGVKELMAGVIVDHYWPNRDRAAISPPVPILDLRKPGRGTAKEAKRLQELLVEVPVEGGAARYFLIGGPPADGGLQGAAQVEWAQELAATAAARAQQRLAPDLRLEELHHRNEEIFRIIAMGADYGRGL